MNPEFIEKNQIVERYLSGKLPYRGRQEFERYCRENPELLEQIKLGEYVHAGARLLEVSGQTTGIHEVKPIWWQRREYFYGLLALCGCLLIAIWVLAAYFADRGQQVAKLQQKMEAGPLKPPASTRTITFQPDRTGPGRATLTLQLRELPQLIELHVDVSYARLNVFRVTVDKKNQARAGTIYNALKDSNGELRFAFNTSALTPGDYAVAIEGVGAKGNRIGVAWFTLRAVE